MPKRAGREANLSETDDAGIISAVDTTKMSNNHLASALLAFGPGEVADIYGEDSYSKLVREAAARVERFERLGTLLGLLAPAGTAPRTALEQIYDQSATSAEESQIVLDLREMLRHHWAEWTPALREAEYLPPETTDTL